MKYFYKSIKDAPKYPDGFKPVQNGTKAFNVNNGQILEKLRKVESGEWTKVLKNGYDKYGNEVSVHYFKSKTGKVFDVETHPGWSTW